VTAEVARGVDLFILNHKRKLLAILEETYDTFIEIERNSSFSPTDCKITIKEVKSEQQMKMEAAAPKVPDVQPPPVPEKKDDAEQKETTMRHQAKPKFSRRPASNPIDMFDSDPIINRTNIKHQKVPPLQSRQAESTPQAPANSQAEHPQAAQPNEPQEKTSRSRRRPRRRPSGQKAAVPITETPSGSAPAVVERIPEIAQSQRAATQAVIAESHGSAPSSEQSQQAPKRQWLKKLFQ
jgi:hypothetical protein